MLMTIAVSTSNKMTCKQCGDSLPKGTVYTIIYTRTKVSPRYCTSCMLKQLAIVLTAKPDGSIDYIREEEMEKSLRECLVETMI